MNRALRKAYGIGICSVEEIGSLAEPRLSRLENRRKLPPQPTNGNGSGRTVRDRLCQVIRQHQLDPNLVKSYATDFCGVKTLRDATREQVENFVAHLADWAEKDRDALLCQLNSYLGSERRCGMKRQIDWPARRGSARNRQRIPDGVFLVRVQRVQFRR